MSLDLAGIVAQLRAAGIQLGSATLAARAGRHAVVASHIALALRELVLIEAHVDREARLQPPDADLDRGRESRPADRGGE